MTDSLRIKIINDKKFNNKGKYILYWMQASQRTEWNMALDYAKDKSSETGKPLVVLLVVSDNFMNANQRHYAFMFDGIINLIKKFNELNIKFILAYSDDIPGEVLKVSQNACMLVGDIGYLKIQRDMRNKIKEKIKCNYVTVEDNVLFPVEYISDKEEYSARTLRIKINKNREFFNINYVEHNYKNKKADFDYKNDFSSRPEKLFEILKVNRDVGISKYYKGGEENAEKTLKKFLNEKIKKYDEMRNFPEYNYQSDLSPYIHFGNISVLKTVKEVLKYDGNEAFTEEFIVRRELAVNFIYYNKNYDNFNGLNEWAKKTLKDHQNDKREYIYTADELENYNTHDEYWNSAQKEMCISGKMHGYMRMYWGKKIIEWTESPEEAWNILVYLNDKYSIDGRDPNGYTGIAWCFGKHDRAWKERNIFGKIRYMNSMGLERKYNMKEYIKKINAL